MQKELRFIGLPFTISDGLLFRVVGGSTHESNGRRRSEANLGLGKSFRQFLWKFASLEGKTFPEIPLLFPLAQSPRDLLETQN